MLQVKSKLIDGVSYNPKERRLTLNLSNGQRRVYIGVPDDVVFDLIEAESPGNYYLQSIKPNFQMDE